MTPFRATWTPVQNGVRVTLEGSHRGRAVYLRFDATDLPDPMSAAVTMADARAVDLGGTLATFERDDAEVFPIRKDLAPTVRVTRTAPVLRVVGRAP